MLKSCEVQKNVNMTIRKRLKCLTLLIQTLRLKHKEATVLVIINCLQDVAERLHEASIWAEQTLQDKKK